MLSNNSQASPTGVGLQLVNGISDRIERTNAARKEILMTIKQAETSQILELVHPREGLLEVCDLLGQWFSVVCSEFQMVVIISMDCKGESVGMAANERH